jgi:hypothetical protein
MILVSGGGAFGASATTGVDSPGIDEKELAAARELGKRVTEVAAVVKRIGIVAALPFRPYSRECSFDFKSGFAGTEVLSHESFHCSFRRFTGFACCGDA